MSDILHDRETRSQEIEQLLVKHPIIISIKANIPGQDKNRFPAHLLVRLFSNLIKNQSEVSRELKESNDGPFMLIALSAGKGDYIKNECISLEESTPIGRFVDIDVYSKDKDHHRSTPRTCVICGESDARICQKTDKHTAEEVIQVIKQKTIEYLKYTIDQLIDDSILCELNLDPKFGLVTPTSSGSHKDMDYALMIHAKEAITPFFIQMFELGIHFNGSPEELMNSIRIIGLEAENAMLEATHGVNAYKGLIFNLGFVVTALGRVLRLHLPFEAIFDELKLMSKPLLGELESIPVSFGIEAFHKYGIGGARKEMSLGLPSVQQTLRNLTDIHQKELYQALVQLIVMTEDTTLLKRTDINTIYLIKDIFSRLDVSDIDEVNAVTTYCIKNNLTFGGSADLLVVSVYLCKVKKLFFTSQDK